MHRNSSHIPIGSLFFDIISIFRIRPFVFNFFLSWRFVFLQLSLPQLLWITVSFPRFRLFSSLVHFGWKDLCLRMVCIEFDRIGFMSVRPDTHSGSWHGTLRGAFHSKKISYTCGKNPFVFKKNPSIVRKNPFVVKESRTLFRKSEMPLGTLRPRLHEIRSKLDLIYWDPIPFSKGHLHEIGFITVCVYTRSDPLSTGPVKTSKCSVIS